MEKEMFLNGEAFQRSKTTFWLFGATLGAGRLGDHVQNWQQIHFWSASLGFNGSFNYLLKMDDFMREDWSL